MDGQLGYWSLNVADTDRAKTFFGAVFGWLFSAPGSEGGTTAGLRDHETGPYLEAADPAGSRFGIWQPAPDYQPPAVSSATAGGIAYFVQATSDLDRSRAFFADLFGWMYGAPGSAGGLPIEGSSPLGFLSPAGESGLAFGVTDIATTVAAIRAAGGTADDPMRSPYGPYASAVDDQGTPFGIFQDET